MTGKEWIAKMGNLDHLLPREKKAERTEYI